MLNSFRSFFVSYRYCAVCCSTWSMKRTCPNSFLCGCKVIIALFQLSQRFFLEIFSYTLYVLSIEENNTKKTTSQQLSLSEGMNEYIYFWWLLSCWVIIIRQNQVLLFQNNVKLFCPKITWIQKTRQTREIVVVVSKMSSLLCLKISKYLASKCHERIDTLFDLIILDQHTTTTQHGSSEACQFIVYVVLYVWNVAEITLLQRFLLVNNYIIHC